MLFAQVQQGKRSTHRLVTGKTSDSSSPINVQKEDNVDRIELAIALLKKARRTLTIEIGRFTAVNSLRM